MGVWYLNYFYEIDTDEQFQKIIENKVIILDFQQLKKNRFVPSYIIYIFMCLYVHITRTQYIVLSSTQV